MLIPRRVKHRKQHHPGRSGAAKGGTKVVFGEYGIQALEPAYVTNRQIESARIAMTRHIRRGGKVWINIYPDRPLDRKSTRLNSSHVKISYAVFCLKKKNTGVNVHLPGHRQEARGWKCSPT